MMRVCLFQILLVVLYVISSQGVPGSDDRHIITKNYILREKLRDFSSNLELSRHEFDSRVSDVMYPVWWSLEDFSKNESQRILEEKEPTFTIPFCYVTYVDYLMRDIKNTLISQLAGACFREDVFKILQTFETMDRYIQVIDTILESIEVCHMEGSELPAEITIQNIFCDHTKHHLHVENWLQELEDSLSQIEQKSLRYNFEQDRICFENAGQQISSNLTNILPVILSECEHAGNYTNMLENLSLLPFSINKFIPSIVQKEITEAGIAPDRSENGEGTFKSLHLALKYEAMLRNVGLFRRLMIVTADMQRVQKYLRASMLLHHERKFNDTAVVLQAIIEEEVRNVKCPENYIPMVLNNLQQYYDLKLAPKCFGLVFERFENVHSLTQTALDISKTLIAVPNCEPVWKCDKVESEIIDMERTLAFWEGYDVTGLLANASTCYDAAREVVRDNALRNREMMKACQGNLQLTQNMFYAL